MPYDSNTNRIYADTVSGKGVTLEDIAMCLGGDQDLKGLCLSPSITEWSKHKPFDVVDGFDEYGVQTEEARRRAAYGLYWWERTREEDAPFSDSAQGCINKALENAGKWKYKRPSRVFRILDFDGYCGNAGKPYLFQNPTPAAENIKYVSAYRDPAQSETIYLSEMPMPADLSVAAGDFRVVVLYRLSGATGAPSVKDTGARVSDLDHGNGISSVALQLPTLTGAATWTYDMVWAATNSYDDPDAPVWVYLPESTDTLQLTAGLTLGYEWGSGEFEVYDNNGNQITGQSWATVRTVQPYLMGANNLSYDVDMRYTFKIWDMDYGRAQTYEDTFVAAGTYSIDPYIEIDVAELSNHVGAIMITLDVSYRRAGSSEQWTNRHFDFLSDTLANYASTEADGVTLLQILNIVNQRRI